MNRGRKFAGLVLSAMLFGTVAGGTMVGVNALSDQYRSGVLAQASNDAGATVFGRMHRRTIHRGAVRSS